MELGIGDCRSRLHPDEKFQVVEQLQQEGKRVAMIGDGDKYIVHEMYLRKNTDASLLYSRN